MFEAIDRNNKKCYYKKPSFVIEYSYDTVIWFRLRTHDYKNFTPSQFRAIANVLES